MSRNPTILAAVVLIGVISLSAVAESLQDLEAIRADHNRVTPRNFDQGGAVSRYFHLNAGAYFSQSTIHRTTATRPLHQSLSQSLADQPVVHRGGLNPFQEYVAADPLLDGVIFLHQGNVVFEAYPRMEPWQRHFAWSLSKIVAAATLARLAEQERIDLARPVGDYVPALRGGAWASIAVQDVADHTSGIACLDSDGYQDQNTCIFKMEQSLTIVTGDGSKVDFLTHLHNMQSGREPGGAYEYVSANTIVLALIIESVTGMTYDRAVQSLIWDEIGAEADGLMAISDKGYAYAAGGLSARLRDIARFGSLFVENDRDVLTRKTVAAMQTGGVERELSEEMRALLRVDQSDTVRAAWQWDLILAEGALYKAGYSGQGLYVDPSRELVVVWFGTGEHYDDVNNEMLPVVRQLLDAGLFDLPSN